MGTVRNFLLTFHLNERDFGLVGKASLLSTVNLCRSRAMPPAGVLLFQVGRIFSGLKITL